LLEWLTGRMYRAMKRFNPGARLLGRPDLTVGKNVAGAVGIVPQSHRVIEIFGAMPDFRHQRGQRHPLTAILALA
jgi:hypothetical protein